MNQEYEPSGSNRNASNWPSPVRINAVLPDASALRPKAAVATAHVAGNLSAYGFGVWLATNAAVGPAGYLLAQLLLTLAFMHSFVLMHEAGHQTLFRSRPLNWLVGHVAGFCALIPYEVWRPIHAAHHRYTGWQDLDPTTALLVPRPLRRWERLLIDLAWRTGLPLFSTLYRLQNFWHLRRVGPYLGSRRRKARAAGNVAVLGLVYAALILAIGPAELAMAIGPALLLALMAQDLLLLSQHTHLPQRLSGGAAVAPFRPREQQVFTRSLRLPAWLSAALLHFDAHELHHIHPRVPGYCLRRFPGLMPNEVHWWTWIKAAKRLSGSQFLFQNRNDTRAPV